MSEQPMSPGPQQPNPSQHGYAGPPLPGPGMQPHHPGPPLRQPPLRPDEENTWALMATFGGLLLGWLAPLIVFAVQKDRSPFVRDVSRQALNMQLSFTIWILVSIPLFFVFVGIFTMIAAGITAFVLTIIGGVKAANRERYRYPLTIEFIK